MTISIFVTIILQINLGSGFKKGMMKNISIILIRPKYPGNIGAAARAMKVMGISDLRLVESCNHHDKEAVWMAHGSEEILDNAKSFKSLKAALRGIKVVIGTTHRTRHIHSPTHYLRDVSAEIVKIAANNRVGILFGPEDKGLLNEELALCDMIATIPQVVEYPSLNLAQAVMVVCYELMMASRIEHEPLAHLASRPQLYKMYEHIVRVIDVLGYGNRELLPEKILQNIRKILGRTTLTTTESNMVRGLCTQIEKFVSDKKSN